MASSHTIGSAGSSESVKQTSPRTSLPFALKLTNNPSMAAVRRTDRNNEWWVDFRFRGRRVRRRSPRQTKRRTEAFERTLRNEMTTDIEAGRDAFAGPSPLYRDFAKRWMRDYVEANNRPATFAARTSFLNNHLVPFLGHLRLDEITTARIDALTAKLKKRSLRPGSIQSILVTLHSSLTIAHEWNELRVVPKVRWPKIGEQSFRYISPEETTRLIQAADPGFWRTFLLVLLHTGMRFGEAAALRWEDLELDCPEPVAHIRQAASRGQIQQTKTSRFRDVPLTADVVAALRNLPRLGELVFPRRDGTVMHPSSTVGAIKRFCKTAGIAPAAWHMTRHTFATTLVAQGAPLPAVQQLLGHATIDMTARYAHVAPSTLRSTVRLLESDSRGNIANRA